MTTTEQIVTRALEAVTPGAPMSLITLPSGDTVEVLRTSYGRWWVSNIPAMLDADRSPREVAQIILR